MLWHQPRDFSNGERVRHGIDAALQLKKLLTSAVPLRSLQEARVAFEREMIQQTLRRHGGKIAPAALDLDVSRPTLYALMEKCGIKKDHEKGK